MATQCPMCKGKGNVPCVLCDGKGCIMRVPSHSNQPAWLNIADAITKDPKALAAALELVNTITKILLGRR